MRVILSFQALNRLEDYLGQLFFHVAELVQVTSFSPQFQIFVADCFTDHLLIVLVFRLAYNDVLKGFTNIIAFFSLLLDSEHETILKELRVHHYRDISRPESA